MDKVYNVALKIDVEEIADNILEDLDIHLCEEAGIDDVDWLPDEIYNKMVSDVLARVMKRVSF